MNDSDTKEDNIETSKTINTLGSDLPREIGRVIDVMGVYLQTPGGGFAASMMRTDINLAIRALADNDIAKMIRAYESLNGYSL